LRPTFSRELREDQPDNGESKNGNTTCAHDGPPRREPYSQSYALGGRRVRPAQDDAEGGANAFRARLHAPAIAGAGANHRPGSSEETSKRTDLTQ
jgi:hypothetical protein